MVLDDDKGQSCLLLQEFYMVDVVIHTSTIYNTQTMKIDLTTSTTDDSKVVVCSCVKC